MADQTVSNWLESLAAKQPTPGGGAVAALAAAVSAAQLGMVAIYTTGPKWQDREASMQKLSDQLSELRAQSLKLVQADAEAFAQVGAAYQLPKETGAEKDAREEAIQKALVIAAEPPIHTAMLARQLIEISGKLADRGNPNVISDVAVGVSLTKAALESAIVNIEINRAGVTDLAEQQKLQTAIRAAQHDIEKADQIIAAVRKKIGNT